MNIKGQTKQSKRHVEAVLASFDILDSFLHAPNQTLKQIIDQTLLTRNRVMRLTGTMEARGYLLRSPITGSYSLGPKLMSLGREYERQSNLSTLSQPMLQELAKATGESASIHIFDELDRVVLAREESGNDLRLSMPVGRRNPINLGASGKIFLAFCSEEMRDKVLKSIFRGMSSSENGVVLSELAVELNRIKLKGHVYCPGVREPHSGIMSAPIFGRENRFLGALVIGGPINRFTDETIPKKIKSLMLMAAKITWRLGGEFPFSEPQDDTAPLKEDDPSDARTASVSAVGL